MDETRKCLTFAYRMHALVLQLEEYVPPECGRTFLKLIDEYNYAKHTKNWV